MDATTPINAYFGDAVIDAGYLVVPHLLHRHYAELGITEEQLVFLLQLMALRWDFTGAPHSLAAIAERMGKNISTVRRYSQQLSSAGLIVVRERTRKGWKLRNDYDLAPLWARLRELARQEATAGGNADVAGHEEPVAPGTLGAQECDDLETPDRAAVSGGKDAEVRDHERAKMHGGHRARMSGLKKTQEDQHAKNAVAAAVSVMGDVLSLSSARKLLARHPEVAPHAAALVRHVRQARARNPGGLLVYLVEHGWTPPVAEQPAGVDEAMHQKFARCPYCQGPTGGCDCGPSWLRDGATADDRPLTTDDGGTRA